MDSHDRDLFETETPPASDPRKMHCHSINAYHEEQAKLSQRASDIIAWIRSRRGMNYTDREIKNGMFGVESDMNMVRPRITELIEIKMLQEVGETTDTVTGKTVRVVGLPL